MRYYIPIQNGKEANYSENFPQQVLTKKSDAEEMMALIGYEPFDFKVLTLKIGSKKRYLAVRQDRENEHWLPVITNNGTLLFKDEFEAKKKYPEADLLEVEL